MRKFLKSRVGALKAGLYGVTVGCSSLAVIKGYLIPQMSIDEAAACVTVTVIVAFLAHRTGIASRLLASP